MMKKEPPITIRRATADDSATLVEFNRALARETEGTVLLPQVIAAGIDNLLANDALGFYIVAEQCDRVVGSLLVTTEWSDWRNGMFWWIQSVYVLAECRRNGVYRAMYQHVKTMAKTDPQVCGFRLYVERENSVAQETYRALGMEETPYRVFEELKTEVRYLEGVPPEALAT